MRALLPAVSLTSPQVCDHDMMNYLKRKVGRPLEVGPLVAAYPASAKFLCSLVDQGKALVVDSTMFILVGATPAKVPSFADKWMALADTKP